MIYYVKFMCAYTGAYRRLFFTGDGYFFSRATRVKVNVLTAQGKFPTAPPIFAYYLGR